MLAAVAVSSCGGGGGSSAPWSGVTIESPTETDATRTDQASLMLAGRSFVPEGSACAATIGTIAPGYEVRWRNAANGASGVARIQLNCLLAVSLTWDMADVPLLPGLNTVTVTATAADGQTGTDSIAITRTP